MLTKIPYYSSFGYFSMLYIVDLTPVFKVKIGKELNKIGKEYSPFNIE